MTTTVTTHDTSVNEPGPAIDEAFVADRQAFWGSFTRFVMMGAIGVGVLLVLLDYFLV